MKRLILMFFLFVLANSIFAKTNTLSKADPSSSKEKSESTANEKAAAQNTECDPFRKFDFYLSYSSPSLSGTAISFLSYAGDYSGEEVTLIFPTSLNFNAGFDFHPTKRLSIGVNGIFEQYNFFKLNTSTEEKSEYKVNALGLFANAKFYKTRNHIYNIDFAGYVGMWTFLDSDYHPRFAFSISPFGIEFNLFKGAQIFAEISLGYCSALSAGIRYGF